MATWESVAEIAASVNSGKNKAIDLIEESLKRIKSNSEYKSIIVTTETRAKERAKQIDQLVKSGKTAGRLAGVPFIAKDNFLVFGAETTAASNMLRGFEAPYQSSAIELLEKEGAICVAKANLDAFAHGSSTENSDFFTTLNPHDKTKVPGGSSGGSAAAIALELAPFALGTDTGGSIRLPASFCGVVGYKPTYGLVSRSGVVAMASSTDVVGPITSNVTDSALIMDVMSGKDSLDGTTIDKPDDTYDHLDSLDPKKIKVGVVKEFFPDGLDAGVRTQVESVIEKYKKLGMKVEEVSLPATEQALAVYYVICPAELSSNLSRYDGQRFGFSKKKVRNLKDSYLESRSEGFGDEAKRRIMIGTYVLSSGYYDAYYNKAQQVRTKLINEFQDAYEKYDILVGPTAPVTAFSIGSKTNDPLSMYLIDVLTVASNLVGCPSISLPIGKVAGMPVGMQLLADQQHDKLLLQFSKFTEEIVE